MMFLGEKSGFVTLIEGSPTSLMQRLTNDFLLRKENTTGSSYVIGHVRSKGIKVQRHRIRASINHVDPLGHVLHRNARKKITQQSYRVPHPNVLWHMDGHHKLIAWGIVIHGCVDGYSRTVC